MHNFKVGDIVQLKSHLEHKPDIAILRRKTAKIIDINHNAISIRWKNLKWIINKDMIEKAVSCDIGCENCII